MIIGIMTGSQEPRLPELITNSSVYTGDPGFLSLMPNVPAWAPSTDHVRIAPNGLYAAGCVRDNGNSFRLVKFTPGAKTWATLPALTGVPTATDKPIVGIGWSRDSQFLALTMLDSPRVLVYQRSGDTFTLLASPADIPPAPGYDAVAWADDNSKLAISTNTSTGNVYVWGFDGTTLTGGRVSTGGLTVGSAFSLSFEPGPSPRWLAGVNATEAAIFDADASPMTAAASVSDSGKVVGWSADGNHIITAGTEAKVYSVSGSGALTLDSTTTTDLPLTGAQDGTVRRLGDAFALGAIPTNLKPFVKSISDADPPVLATITPPNGAGQVLTASWRQ